MLEKWRNKLNKGKFIGVMFMKLLKVFDSINQILLVAKLEAYAFSGIFLHVMKSYLKNYKQSVNINSNFS